MVAAKNWRIFSAILLTLSILSSGHARSDLPAMKPGKYRFGEYSAIRNTALAILRKYPPSEYLYVGIGRSPTPVIAAIQAILGTESARNVPFSNRFKDFDPDKPLTGGKIEENMHGILIDHDERIMHDRKDRARFWEVFKKKLPKFADLGGKKILVIDFVASGASLKNGVLEMQKFYQHMEPGKKLPTVVGLGLTVPGAQIYVNLPPGTELLTPSGILTKAMDHRRYISVSEYTSPYGGEEPARQASYDALRADLAARFRTDVFVQSYLQYKQTTFLRCLSGNFGLGG